MKIFVITLQFLLSLWNITGSAYMMSNYPSLINEWATKTFPSVFWIVLGIIQILLSVGLLISSGNGPLRRFATPSAFGLALVSLFGAVLYVTYAGFPGILWAIVPAVLLLFVAYKRRV